MTANPDDLLIAMGLKPTAETPEPTKAAPPTSIQQARTAIAFLLVHAARSDNAYIRLERNRIRELLARRFKMTEVETLRLINDAEVMDRRVQDLGAEARSLAEALDEKSRLTLMEMLWDVVLIDEKVHPGEKAMMDDMIEMLGLSAEQSKHALARVVAQRFPQALSKPSGG